MKADLPINNLTVSAEGVLDHLAARVKYVCTKRKTRTGTAIRPIAPPEPRRRLVAELSKSTRLSDIRDGKQLFLVDYAFNSSVIRELGRLRELCFREIGEGVQAPRDLDKFDKTYRHIVLWDHTQREIAGAYRLGEVQKLVTTGTDGRFDASNLYTHELFDYGANFNTVFPRSIELGRSFIQTHYRDAYSLDLLWQGIGAYLVMHPKVRYLFGAVSLSNDYPNLAKHEIVAFYQHFYQPTEKSMWATAKQPFFTNRSVQESYRAQNLRQAQRCLIRSLTRQCVGLPPLYKHYSNLCTSGGVNFIDFGVDPSFGDCIDALVLIDMNRLKQNRRKRYLTPSV